MGNMQRGGLELRDEDRLPWLEAVGDFDENKGSGSMRMVGGVIAALVALALVIGGVWWMKNRSVATSGNGSLILAQPGPYKVKPEEPGGMPVEGEGDAAFAASSGAEATGRIDTAALPEAPIQGQVIKGAVETVRAAPVATVKVTDGGTLPAPAARTAATMPRPVGARGGGSLIQLGAYANEASANAAWKRMTTRFQFLAPLEKSIVSAKIGENTLYRLRANAGSDGQAADLCGRLKVAGENCLIAAQ